MLLRKLGLTNVGLFQGKHEFELVPRKSKTTSRPITLIGGMNGAGKTTILDSLRLGLYGKDMLGSKITQNIYDNYLENLIHRSKDPKLISSEASIQIEFEHSYLGTKDIYLVDRSWYKNGSGVVESLIIKKNGKPTWHVRIKVACQSKANSAPSFEPKRANEAANPTFPAPMPAGPETGIIADTIPIEMANTHSERLLS